MYLARKRAYQTTIIRNESVQPTFSISALNGASNILSMQIVASEVVTGFTVGDITISVGGSLTSFATTDNKTFTVSWTLAAGANTMNIASGVCTDAVGNTNLASSVYNAGFLTLQPDSTSDIDTTLKGGDGANYSTSQNCWLGYLAGSVRRILIRFDLTSVPTFATISSSTFTLNQEAESSTSARRVSLYKQKRDWLVSQANWNKYSIAGNWQTVGGLGLDDCEQVEWVGRDFSATEANGAKTFTLPATTKSDFGAYGWLIKLSDENADSYLLSTCNSVTAGNRPKLVIVYYVNSIDSDSYVPAIDTPYYYPEGWTNILDEHFTNYDAWYTRDTTVYQDTIWLAEQVTIRDGGGLRLTGTNEPYGEVPYRGGLAASRSQWLYGYFECYCKIPSGYLWPVFFIYDELRHTEGHPKNEIDICEWLGTNIVYVSTHIQPNVWQQMINSVDISLTYHKWGCYWDANVIRIYLDDHLFAQITDPVQVPQVPMNIDFQMSIDGWAWPPTNVTFPVYFDVDWVKVWRKN